MTVQQCMAATADFKCNAVQGGSNSGLLFSSRSSCSLQIHCIFQC